MKGWFLYSFAFLSGYLIMSLELMGFRVLAPYFGYSIYVFGSLIGLILLALSVGYLLGGFLGDRGVTPVVFFRYALAGAAYLALAAAAHPRILEYLARSDNVIGSLAATFALFFVPMVALAAFSPYCIKLLAAAPQSGVGVSAGSVYAVSTLGSILGTFLTSFYFVPAWGVRATFRMDAALFLLLAILPLLARRRFMPLLALPLIMMPVFGISDAQVIYGRDSAYQRLEVVDYGSFWGLRTDRRSGAIHSYRMKPGVADEGFMLYNLFAVPPAIHPVRDTLLLGVAGGVIPAVHARFGQELRIHGVELDPAMAEVGKRYFSLGTPPLASLTIADARAFLASDAARYDLIEIDLFTGSGEIPFHVATQEFFELAARHLNPGGMLAMNIFDPSRGILKDPIVNTIAAVYADVRVVDVGTGSYFVLAFRDGERIASPHLNGVPEGTRAAFTRIAQFFTEQGERTAFNPHALVLTDDRAPLEQLSYQAFSGSKK